MGSNVCQMLTYTIYAFMFKRNMPLAETWFPPCLCTAPTPATFASHRFPTLNYLIPQLSTLTQIRAIVSWADAGSSSPKVLSQHLGRFYYCLDNRHMFLYWIKTWKSPIGENVLLILCQHKWIFFVESLHPPPPSSLSLYNRSMRLTGCVM